MYYHRISMFWNVWIYSYCRSNSMSVKLENLLSHVHVSSRFSFKIFDPQKRQTKIQDTFTRQHVYLMPVPVLSCSHRFKLLLLIIAPVPAVSVFTKSQLQWNLTKCFLTYKHIVTFQSCVYFKAGRFFSLPLYFFWTILHLLITMFWDVPPFMNIMHINKAASQF